MQGGFAKCYELKEKSSGNLLAGKIVPKSLLQKQHQREKMSQEITLHKTLNHKFVVKLFSYFEDSNFVYIILELCRRRSLMELHKRRRAITEIETRYFMHQILLGVEYLHRNKIIHRDLKLGNIFLNDEMEVIVNVPSEKKGSISTACFVIIRSNSATLDWQPRRPMTANESEPCAELQTTLRRRC